MPNAEEVKDNKGNEKMMAFLELGVSDVFLTMLNLSLEIAFHQLEKKKESYQEEICGSVGFPPTPYPLLELNLSVQLTCILLGLLSYLKHALRLPTYQTRPVQSAGP